MTLNEVLGSDKRWIRRTGKEDNISIRIDRPEFIYSMITIEDALSDDWEGFDK